jgi:Domain of unknown function (DUF2017)
VVGTPKIVTRAGSGYVLHIGKDERAVVARLLRELQAMQADPEAADAVARLFPVVHPADEQQEAEYQRLMRHELVASRSAAIDTVLAVLARPGRKIALDDAEMTAFLQAVNSVRLVLGTILDVGEDDDLDAPDELLESPEYQLYGYLSFVLDAAVRAMSHGLP